MSGAALAAIEEILSRHMGLDAGSIGRRAIDSAINARMRVLDVRNPDDYHTFVSGRADELAALVEEVVVNETWFLRDRTPFAYVARHARDHWKTLRVLSVPCSTGEEPYSIAIALLDAGFAPSDFTIDAYDISSRALAVARRGVYGAIAFRGDDGELRDKHFRQTHDGWLLREEIRESVTFTRGNLMDPGCFEPGLKYNAIFCRNLLIYLTADARAAVLRKLDGMLEPHGLFVVGHAESAQVMDGRFRPVDTAGSFTFVRVADSRIRRASAPPPAPRSPTPARGMAVPMRPTPRRMTPIPTRDRTPPPEPRDLLADAAALADRGDLASATALVRKHLEAGADAKGYTLLGTIHQAGGALDDAEQCFSKALYLDPAHYNALVQLALLKERRGDAAGAAQLRRRAARARGDK